MTSFDYKDYKSAIRDTLLDRKRLDKSMTFQRLALECRITKTYLSRVFAGDAELSEDQLFRACRFLGFGSHERRYISLLHAEHRSSDSNRKAEIKAELQVVRQDQCRSENHLKAQRQSISSTTITEYMLDPLTQVVHMMLSIEPYRSDITLVKKALKLSDEEFQKHTNRLRSEELVVFKGGRATIVRDSFHFPKDSIMFPFYRRLMRLSALNQTEKASKDQQHNFSVIFTGNEQLRIQIQELFLEFIAKVENLVKSTGQANKSKVYQMVFDLFPWH